MAQFRETPYGVFNYLVNLDDGTGGRWRLLRSFWSERRSHGRRIPQR